MALSLLMLLFPFAWMTKTRGGMEKVEKKHEKRESQQYANEKQTIPACCL
jgi:hypothetical protein